MKPITHAHYQAHLLALMGISRFGLRTPPCTPSQASHFAGSYDRLQSLHTVRESPAHTPAVSQFPTHTPSQPAHHTANPVASAISTPADAIAEDTKPMITSSSEVLTPIAVHSDRFGLLAMTYRYLVIIADKAHTDTLTLGIWQALSDKLTSLAAQANHPPTPTQAGVSYQLSYPLLSPPNSPSTAHTQANTMAQMAMTGFLFPLVDLADRYAKQHARSVQFIALTQLSAGLVLQAPSLAAPSLADMAHYRQAKLDLWQLLHA